MMKKNKEASKPIIVQKFSSVDPADWEEILQAGCKMWVNHGSGEVSDYPPWKSMEVHKSHGNHWKSRSIYFAIDVR